MNVHFIAWMSITFTFLTIGGGAYVCDAFYPRDSGLIDIWGHPPTHTRLSGSVRHGHGVYERGSRHRPDRRVE